MRVIFYKIETLMTLIFISVSYSFAQNLLTNNQSLIFLSEGASITINGNSSFNGNESLKNNGLISFSGNAVFNLSDSSDNLGNVKFFKNTNQILNSNQFLNFNNISVEKTSGGEITLNTNIGVESTVFLGSGVLDINNSNLILRENGILTTENEDAYITGQSGYIEVNGTLNFPVGSNISNIGIEITTLSDLGNTIIRRYHTPTNLGSNPGVKRMFEIIPENELVSPATLTYYYIDNEVERGGIPEELIYLNTFIDNNWIPIFGERNTANNSVTVSNINSFNLFTGSLAGGAFLPVEFLSFDVENINNEYAKVSWTTATEINNDFFTVQRSADGINFEDIATQTGAGNSTSIVNYTHNDNEPLQGVSYYRIKQTDFDGEVDYSNIKSVLFNLQSDVILFPNPSNRFINLTGITNHANLYIYNYQGALMGSFEVFNSSTNTNHSFNIENLATGLYFIQILNDFNQSEVFNFIKN